MNMEREEGTRIEKKTKESEKDYPIPNELLNQRNALDTEKKFNKVETNLTQKEKNKEKVSIDSIKRTENIKKFSNEEIELSALIRDIPCLQNYVSNNLKKIEEETKQKEEEILQKAYEKIQNFRIEQQEKAEKLLKKSEDKMDRMNEAQEKYKNISGDFEIHMKSKEIIITR